VRPALFATSVAISTVYQFWIHTQLVGRIGYLEWFLNAASHHRVHHAINPRYLDKNHGAILIVWDRLFGTYIDETEPCVYGLVGPLRSYNPLWAQLHYFVDLARRSASGAVAGGRAAGVVEGPLVAAGRAGGPKVAPEVSVESFVKYPSPAGRGALALAGVLFVVATAAGIGLLYAQGSLSLAPRVGGAVGRAPLARGGGAPARRAAGRAAAAEPARA